MQYQNLVDPELKRIAKRIPYHKAMIGGVNLFQTIALGLTKIPGGLNHRKLMVEGYRGMKYRVDLFEPAGAEEALPGLLYAHGGAFSYKASAYHKRLACLYAQRARCRVFFPDYHLAPPYPYPAAYEDILALYRLIAQNAGALRVRPERLGLAGDSAGAALAALVCNRYEEERIKQPCLQMLIYPVTDGAMRTESMKSFSDTPLWNAKNNRRMWAYYCKEERERYAASPLYGELPRAVPDTYIETAEYDCLHDEGVLYAQKLRSAGARVELNETKGTVHGYDVALKTQIAARSLERRIAFLKRGFDPKARRP